MEDQNKVKSTSSLTVHVILKLTEKEARALKAITLYGDDAFLKNFYENLGHAYLKPHEDGVRSLFKTIKEELPKHLDKADKARDIWREAAKNN